MHEAALAHDMVRIIEEVARSNAVSRVSGARLLLGELTAVDPETLSFAFEVQSRGTVAEGCVLYVERAPLRVACPSCEYDGAATEETLGCPRCGAPVRVTSGRQMRLVAIDTED